LPGQQLQSPARAARGRVGAGGRHQQRLFLARELASRARTRLLAERRFQVAFDEAALGPVHRRSADGDADGDVLVAGPGIGCQQDLRPLELARGVRAAAQQSGEFVALVLAQLHSVTYIHRCPLRLRAQQMNQMPGLCLRASAPGFTPKQGQYLAFIHAYTLVLGRPPAEADLKRFFRVTPPSVHQMVLSLERSGLIRRQPGIARSITVLVDPEALPPLRASHDQLVKSSVQRY
jgi:hypothetical protein